MRRVWGYEVISNRNVSMGAVVRAAVSFVIWFVIWPAALSVGAVSCFEPTYPEGIPCSEAQTCPPGQICDVFDNVCRVDPSADPCGADPCGAEGACVREGQGYRCECSAGYEDDGVTCVEIDECGVGEDPCGVGGTCVDGVNGYTCTCAAGYEDDGTTCAEIDECGAGQDPCGAGGACIDGVNEYTCACEAGYDFDGATCVLITHGLVGAGTADEPRRWDDGTAAVSCQEYLAPALPYLYEGSTGDGVYVIQPPGLATPVPVLCDMTTDGGGWTGIDPAAAFALGGTALAVRAEGTTITCGVDASGALEAFYVGSGTRTMVCQYDIELGFFFDTVRVSAAAGEVLALTAVTSPDTHTTDVSNLLDLPWGENVVAGGRGDVVLGSAAHGAPVLSLGAALGSLRSFANGAIMTWPAAQTAATTLDTVLRIQLSESGSENEGYRWSTGRVFVR